MSKQFLLLIVLIIQALNTVYSICMNLNAFCIVFNAFVCTFCVYVNYKEYKRNKSNNI